MLEKIIGSGVCATYGSCHGAGGGVGTIEVGVKEISQHGEKVARISVWRMKRLCSLHSAQECGFTATSERGYTRSCEPRTVLCRKSPMPLHDP